MGDNAICEHGVMRSLCGQPHDDDDILAVSDARFLLDALGCSTIREAKALVDLGRTAAMVDADPRTSLRVVGLRDATAAEIVDEPDGVLESMANGDLEVSDTTRHLAQAELDHRRRPR